MKFGIKEYWIVSSKNKHVIIFIFDEEIKAYGEPIVYTKNDTVSSSIFSGLSMELRDIFE